MARRQQVAGGMDIMGVLSNVPVAVTFLLAIVGWWTAFIGQIIFESKYDRAGGSGSAVGVSWFAIFLQLAVILTLFWVLARGTLEIYRFQLTAFISILVVFSVIGVNQGIFGPISSQTAIGAGWLLLAIVNVLWLLFITADDETRLALVFSSYAGEVTPHRTRSIMRQSRRTSSALGISNNQSSVTDFHSSHNHHAPGSAGSMNGGMSGGGGSGAYGSGGPGYGGKMQSSNGYAPPTIVMSPAVGGGNSGSMGGRAATPQQLYSAGGGAQMSQSAPHNLGGPAGSATGSSLASQAPMAASAPTQDMPASTSSTNMSAGGAAKDTSAATASAAGAAGGAGSTTVPFKMKASFSYTASPDDPNEISFVKGEILEILDNSGKWFNARKHDGQEGIVPSNYLEALP